MNGKNETIAGLAGGAPTGTGTRSGSVTNKGAVDSALTLNVSGTQSFGGVISDGATNKLSLIKSGGGTQILSGTNTYTGGTQIDLGTLTLGHATDTLADTGAVNVNGGELSIGGNSDTVGAVTLTSGSITGSGGTLTGTGYSVKSGTISAKLGGSGAALAKDTAGSVTLTGANSYGGGTTITDGTLVLANNSAAGDASSLTSAVTLKDSTESHLQINSDVTTLANDITFSSTNANSSVIRMVAGSGTYDVGTSGSLKSAFTEPSNDKPDTTADILEGTNSSASDATLKMSFSITAPTGTTNDAIRRTDIFTLSGVSANTVTTETTDTDTFVIQLSAAGLATDSVLAWNDGSSWVNAVNGNVGTAGSLAGSYAQSFASFLTEKGGFNATSMLGAYGFDSGGTSVWAVVNHTGTFTAVPELSNVLIGGLLGVGLLRRRRKF